MAKKQTARQKAARHYSNLIAKAEANLAKATNLQNRLRKAGVLESGIDLQRQKDFIRQQREYLESDKRFSKQFQKRMEVIREKTHRDYYTSLMKINEQTQIKKGKFSLPSSQITKVSELQKISRRYAKNPQAVSTEDLNRATAFQAIINPVSQANAMNATATPAQARIAKIRTSAKRDASFGGTSTLINDLAYSAGANPLGRDMVDMIITLMQNDEYYTAIETLYKTTDEGREIKRQLDQAVGADWYEEFKTAIQAIIQLIKLIKTRTSLTQAEDDALGSLLERYEGEGESYEKG